jgi:hypothetical protein
MDRNEVSNLYRGPSIDAAYQVLVHTGIHLLNVVSLKYDHFFIAKLIIFIAYVNWALFFLAHLAKGNVSFCHHLVSVVH